MNPVQFPEANAEFGPPADLEETQCMTIPAFAGIVRGGSVDGAKLVVVAWRPTVEEAKQIAEGSPVFISMLGGLAPHFLTTNFQSAIKPQ